MSEKRFKFVKPLGFTNLLKKDVFIKDMENDYYIRFVEEVVDLLNELNEENEQLRQKLGECYKKWNNSMDIARLNQNSTRDLLEENRELRNNEDVYKEVILTMLGILAENGLYFSGVKDE